MLSNILKEFLIRVGYKIDKASEKEFTDSVDKVTKRITEIAVVAEAAAAAVVAGFTAMSDAAEKFYFMSQRSNATVAGIKAMSFAGQQLGVTAEEVQASIEGLGAFLRTNPLAKSFIEGRLGVKTTDANGQRRDTAAIMADMGKAFAAMPLYMANAYASTLGISEKEVMALRQGMAGYTEYYQGLLRRLGVDEEASARAAHGFMVEIRNTQAILGVMLDRIVLLLGPRLTSLITGFRVSVENNFSRIADAIAKASVVILNIADFISRLVWRGVELLADLYDAFTTLPRGIQLVIMALAGLELALKIGLLSNPITAAIYAIGAAILALYDDFKVFQEGGRHLIDWQGLIDGLNYVKSTMASWWAALVSMWQSNTGYIRTYFEFWLLIPSAIYNHWSGLKAFFANLWANITLEFQSAWGYIEPIITKIKGGVDWIAKSWLGRKLGAGVSAVEGAASAAGQALTPVASKVGAAARWIGGKVAAGADALTGLEDQEVGGAIGSLTAGGGGKPNTSAPAPAKQSAGSDLGGAAAFAFWKSKGFSDAGAAAMVAQEQHEGGFNPRAVGDNGQALGLFQWHSARRQAIMQQTGIDVSTATATQQREAMYLEMKNHIDALAGKAFDAIRTAVDPRAAAALGVNYVERPLDRVTNDRVRGNTAAEWYSKADQMQMASGGGVDINQTNNYNINGQNPETIASAISNVQKTTNAQLLRNTKGAAL